MAIEQSHTAHDDSFEHRLADYARSLFEGAIPDRVFAAAKMRVVDTVACALGAYHEEPVLCARELAMTREALAGAALWVTGERVFPEVAAFVNGTACRVLDFNDVYLGREGGHPSDSIPAAWAVAESTGAGGEQFLRAVIAGYEIHALLADSGNLRDRGFDNVLYGAVAAAVMAGLLLHLDGAALTEAIRLVTVSSVPLLQTRYGELSMWKGMASAQAAHNGVWAAFLALHGIDGPPRIFEGSRGLAATLTQAFTYPDLSRPPEFKITQTRLKPWAAQYPLLTAVEAAIALNGRVGPDEIEQISVETFAYVEEIAARDPEKWRPQTRETADHSLPYCIAVALLDGNLTPQSFDAEHLANPTLKALIERMRITVDPSVDEPYPADTPVRLSVVTRDRRRLEERVVHALGSPARPLAEAELEQKYRRLTVPVLGESASQRLLSELDRLESLSALPAMSAPPNKDA